MATVRCDICGSRVDLNDRHFNLALADVKHDEWFDVDIGFSLCCKCGIDVRKKMIEGRFKE